uniref:NADH-ubiquinone oxidoreductase chain 4 n=1 Tax=Candida orthopsilosis TaxID=273371 RepID=A0A1G4DH50_9ASCO|nr:Nad4p [Candida orthopsilosis]SBT62535.1 Nad4p [Candida orthopsilosis]SBT62550.1 Nad4p [Candida orthopsilosis]SBT62566.1 Nad4p [Candida orthopsilosis]SBT62582.1 Nad4p [Candida orthopsilosis]
MTLIYFMISSTTSMMSRTFKGINKSIMLMASMLMVIPTTYDWNELDMYYTTDGMADMFMLLTAYTTPLSMMANWNSMKSTLYYELVFNLGMILLMNFMCQDMLSFYMYFEASLAPLFMLMGLYGANNREKAADYMLMYTLLSSLFMLMAMAVYEVLMGNTDYQAVSLLVLSLDLQCILFLGMSMGIMVKTPLVPVHTWLPVVHSESPLAGSMLLAGVMLKLAVYAMMRLMLPTLSDASTLYTPVVYMVCMMTIMYTSMMTLRQTDLKVMVAYSSMSHMAVCMLGIMSNNMMGISGSLMLSMAHGFVSPALFIMVGGMLYDRYHNRLIYYYQGLLTYMPMLAMYLIMLSFCNMGTPLSVNFMGELLSLAGALNRVPVLGALALMSVLLSASYMLKVTNRLTGGIKTPYMSLTHDCTFRESVLLMSLIMPTMWYGLYPNGMANMMWSMPKLLYMFILLNKEYKGNMRMKRDMRMEKGDMNL